MFSRKLKKMWVGVVLFIILLIIVKDKQLRGSLPRFQRNIFQLLDKIDVNEDSQENRRYKMRESVNDTVSPRKPQQNSRPVEEKINDREKSNDTEMSNESTPYLSGQSTRLLDQSCKPHEVVVFIKTHKTGSSTMTNILNRYADLNDLKVALPMGKFNRFHWPLPFHWSSVDLWRLDGDTPSILCNHARYNRPAMQLIMRKEAKYVTILRNPVEQYESMFNYMEFNTYLQLNISKNPLADFVENPVPVLYKMREKFRGIPESMNLVKNPMFFDLGHYPPAYDNMTRVVKEIAKIGRDFELVMIMEYFDESLILLKKAFCWKLEDIVYVKFNQRRQAPRITLTERVKKNIRKWNKADVLLYEFFNKTLWAKIEKYGPSFWSDLKEFRKLNSKTVKMCVDKRAYSEKAVNLHGEVRSFRINPLVSKYDRYFCKKIIRNEINYIDYFRLKYKPYGSYQNLLEREGKKKPSTRELIERLQIASNIRFASSNSIPRAVA